MLCNSERSIKPDSSNLQEIPNTIPDENYPQIYKKNGVRKQVTGGDVMGDTKLAYTSTLEGQKLYFLM